jgi:hypothetical protein
VDHRQSWNQRARRQPGRARKDGGGGILDPVDHVACSKLKDATKLGPRTVEAQNELAPATVASAGLPW